MTKKKKFVLASSSLIFDDMNMLMDFLLQGDNLDKFRDHVIGQYIGEIEIQQKINIKNTKKTYLYAETKKKPSKPQVAPHPYTLVPDVPNFSTEQKKPHTCHFDYDPSVKTIQVKDRIIGLCELHLDAEALILKGELSLDDM